MRAFRSTTSFSRAALLGLGLALGGTVIAAIAATPVTFEDGNAWSQLRGSLSQTDYKQDYTVAGHAGKTLALRLFSKSPNIYMKVTGPTGRKPLLDTIKTGETTWSAPMAADGDYTVEVYMLPEIAKAKAEDTPYALQVGVY